MFTRFCNSARFPAEIWKSCLTTVTDTLSGFQSETWSATKSKLVQLLKLNNFYVYTLSRFCRKVCEKFAKIWKQVQPILWLRGKSRALRTEGARFDSHLDFFCKFLIPNKF